MSEMKEKKGIKASFKSMDTEETLDIWFNRPIGYMWALFFKKLHVHPNVVTILSIFLGVGAGIMFYYPDMTHTLSGIFLLMWANHYDSDDGHNAKYQEYVSILIFHSWRIYDKNGRSSLRGGGAYK